MYAALVGAVRILMWLGRALFDFLVWWLDYTAARQTKVRGGVRCPKGHFVETEGQYQCLACGFTYSGSVWQCKNPECGATTPFVDCPDCSLSIRSPHRFGR